MASFDSGEVNSLNFVRRYLYPSQSPVIENEDGTVSTHRMASSEFDGRYVAYPTIVEKDGVLEQLEDDEAFDYAVQTGEFIEFPTDIQARRFAEGEYKRQWGIGELSEEYNKADAAGDRQRAFEARRKAREWGADTNLLP